MPSDPLLNQGPQLFPEGSERLVSDPPRQSPQGTRASGLESSVATLGSLTVHAALGLAMLLAIDVQKEEPPVVQAELWSSLPAEIAANAPLAPAPTPSPPIKDIAPAQPNAEEAEIALAKKKAEEEETRRRAEEQAEKDRALKAKQADERKRLADEQAERNRLVKEKAEKDRQDKLKQARITKEKEEAERRKKRADEKAARERAELEQRRKEATERIREEQLAQVRQSLGQDPKAKAADNGDDLRTKAGVAGGAEIGDRTGVLADYAASIRARIRNRISFDPARAPDNPEVVFVVEQQATGRVLKVTKKKSSGNAGWDAAVERAIWGSSPLPKTADGSVENPLTLAFRPLDRPPPAR